MLLSNHPLYLGHVLRPTTEAMDHFFANWFVRRSARYTLEISASTRSRRSLFHRRRLRSRCPHRSNWGCPAAPWSSQKKPWVRRWRPWPTCRLSLCGCHPPTEERVAHTGYRASDCGEDGCHRRLRPPSRCLRIRRGTHPADYPVAHPPPRRLLRPGRRRTACHMQRTGVHCVPVRDEVSSSVSSSWRIS